TFGHALEGLYAQNQTTLKHGEAVAAGMIMELFLSHKKSKFNLDAMFSIISQISEHFDWIEIKPGEKEKIIEYMKFDKKNRGSKISCVLLKNIGEPIPENIITDIDIKDALNFYTQLSK
ncbi:MAG: 3-dehydroquinate synthase, partial [Bacteroidota bacterium]|nr:3-dehydroquinate synthase [Bacteroidota bacterium]